MMRASLVLLAISLVGIGCGDDGGRLVLTGVPCETAADCNDGYFCNGEEVCLGGQCAALNNPPDCDDGVDCTADSCSDEDGKCLHEPPDADGDGVTDAACRDADGLATGSDCDDSDPNRYPDNPEICDVLDHDEDCDPRTFGSVDADGDGLFDVGCCNVTDAGTFCGNDCDDGNPAIGHGSQICENLQDAAAVLICQNDGTWVSDSCDGGQACIIQPNELGVCVPVP